MTADQPGPIDHVPGITSTRKASSRAHSSPAGLDALTHRKDRPMIRTRRAALAKTIATARWEWANGAEDQADPDTTEDDHIADAVLAHLGGVNR